MLTTLTLSLLPKIIGKAPQDFSNSNVKPSKLGV
jgi:hypothetical protein